jgi:hypothetical protein
MGLWVVAAVPSTILHCLNNRKKIGEEWLRFETGNCKCRGRWLEFHHLLPADPLCIRIHEVLHHVSSEEPILEGDLVVSMSRAGTPLASHRTPHVKTAFGGNSHIWSSLI